MTPNTKLIVRSAYGIVIFLAGFVGKELVISRSRDDAADVRVAKIIADCQAREDSIVRVKDAEKAAILARELADKNSIIEKLNAKFDRNEERQVKRDKGLVVVENQVSKIYRTSNQINSKPKKQ